jgi:Zn-dependent M28 family amino/carboxypeptidase
MRNVLGRFNLGAPTRILFLAHWDTRPKADGPKSSDPNAPVPGANDGGSGVAVLLAIADALRALPPTTGVDLLLVDGEDYGIFAEKDDVLVGSKYFADHPPDGPTPRYAILFDLVGDLNQRFPKEGNSLIGAPDVVKEVWDAARQIGYGHVFVNATGQAIIDDHVPLQQAGIPAINIIDFDYPYWHTPEDTIDKISAASLQTVGEVALEMVHREERRR